MRAVRVHYRPVSILMAKLLGRCCDCFTLGPTAPTRLDHDVPEPELPNARWVKLDVIACGICGADVATLTFKRSATSVLAGAASFPIGLGHEIVARVAEAGADVTRVKPGDRVVVETFLGCEQRGIDPPCVQCAAGNYTACEHLIDGGDIGRGVQIGNNNFTGGGWGKRLVAHEESCTILPDEISDDAGVVLEPFGCCLHAVTRRAPVIHS